jgi:hypothetical protein
MNQNDDLTIKRIREARHSISEKCGHDPQQVVDYYLELQKEYQSRLLATELEKAPEVNLPAASLRLSTKAAL